MFLSKLALKNLTRHKRRTLITAAIISMAVFIYIVFDSLLMGFNEMNYQNIIDFESGHLQIATLEYWEKKEEMPLKNLLVFNEDLAEMLKKIAGFKGLSPQLDFRASLNNGQNELPIIGRGVIAEEVQHVFALNDYFVEGNMFQGEENKAVLGKRLAELMKLKVGDYFTLLIRDKNNTFNTIELEVSGLLHTTNPMVNQTIVYLPLQIAQRSLGFNNEVSTVAVRLNNKKIASVVADELNEKLVDKSSLRAYPWDKLEAISFMQAKQSANQLILAIILLIGAIGIINTVILAALERMGEIGMMKALGLQVKEIVFIFVLESTGIGILGGIIGCIFGAIGVTFFKIYGLDFSAFMDIDMASFGVAVLGKLYGAWNPHAFIIVFSFGVLVSLLISILPAYWAAKKDPVKAIYHR